MAGIEEEFQETLDLGRENQEFISLGKAWCTNIRVDRGDWGVGIVEQATGLPVSGGGFACDFARNPGGMSAMRLASSSLAFYEDNCRGCEHRSPGGRVPNLGTWAEGLMADRERREEVQAEEDRVAGQEWQRRIERRRVVSASLDAAAHEVVALINRLDTDPSDEDAAEKLRTTARLAPDSFPDEVIAHLYKDAPLLKMPIFVEVLLELEAQANPPQLRSLCVTAVRDRWAIAEGCEYLSRHAMSEDVTEDLIEVAVFHAVPSGFPFENVPGEPGALLRFHSLAPKWLRRRSPLCADMGSQETERWEPLRRKHWSQPTQRPVTDSSVPSWMVCVSLKASGMIIIRPERPPWPSARCSGPIPPQRRPR